MTNLLQLVAISLLTTTAIFAADAKTETAAVAVAAEQVEAKADAAEEQNKTAAQAEEQNKTAAQADKDDAKVIEHKEATKQHAHEAAINRRAANSLTARLNGMVVPYAGPIMEIPAMATADCCAHKVKAPAHHAKKAAAHKASATHKVEDKKAETHHADAAADAHKTAAKAHDEAAKTAADHK